VGITVGTDSEMTPRQQLGASAYAFNADMVDGSNIFKTTAAPNGLQTGSQGDITLDTTNNKLYIKSSGTNTNTGWSEVATALSGLTDANISSVAAGNILVMNGSNKWANVAMSGDVTMDSTGAVTIAPNAITDSKIANSTITFDNLASNSCANGQVPKYNGTSWGCGDDNVGSASYSNVVDVRTYGAKV